MHVSCGADPSLSPGMGLWSWPGQWNSVLGSLLELLRKRNFLCPGIVDQVDYKPGAAGSHLATTKEVWAWCLAGEPRNRDLMSMEITWAPDSSCTWRYPWTFHLSETIDSPVFLKLFWAIWTYNWTNPDWWRKQRSALEVLGRSDPGGVNRKCKDSLQDSLAHLGNTKEASEAGI